MNCIYGIRSETESNVHTKACGYVMFLFNHSNIKYAKFVYNYTLKLNTISFVTLNLNLQKKKKLRDFNVSRIVEVLNYNDINKNNALCSEI